MCDEVYIYIYIYIYTLPVRPIPVCTSSTINNTLCFLQIRCTSLMYLYGIRDEIILIRHMIVDENVMCVVGYLVPIHISHTRNAGLLITLYQEPVFHLPLEWVQPDSLIDC